MKPKLIVRRFTLVCTLGILMVFGSAPRTSSAQDTRRVVNVDAVQDTISRHIYGHFAEHLGRDIYGGFWVQKSEGSSGEGAGTATDPPSGPSSGWQYNEDVIEALRAIDIPNVRWPGGCFADTYHWKEAIGPLDERKAIVNTHWGGVSEDNSFGTHEFMGLVERLGAEPFIVGNGGSGTVEEMADWWDIKYWGVGNENWICGGNMTAEYYSDLYRRFATYTRHHGDGELYEVATGPSANNYGGHEAWTETLMQESGPMIDGLSLHFYVFVDGVWEGRGSATDFTEDEWFSAMYQARRFDDIITRYSTIMDRYDPEKRVGLSIDEWGMWHKVEPGTNPGFLYQQNALRDALVAAVSLNIFNQHADRVEIANIAQTINVLQAMILTKGDDMILTPTYHVFDMYQVHHDAALLPTATIEDGSYEHGGRSIPTISSSASRDEEGRMHVTIANMDPNRARKVQLKFRGAAVAGVSTGRVLTADAMQAHNTFDEPEAVKPEPFDGTEVSGNTLSVQMPSKSVVVLELE
jgi:alpha-N-arabinofuranosidase